MGFGGGHQRPGMSFGPPVTPPVVKNLLIGIAVVFALQLLTQNAYTNVFAVQPLRVWQEGWLWQPFTYMWFHGSFMHAALNGFVLWMFGSQMAMAWGAQRFLRFYLLCGIGAGFIIAVWPYVAYGLGLASAFGLRTFTLGASGAIYGVMLAYSLTWPDRTIMLIFPPVAFRAIWLIPIVFGMTMLMSPNGNISHLGHLGGVIVGWLYMRRHGRTGPLFSWSQLKYRWRRYRMRGQLRAVRHEEAARRRKRRNDDRTIH
ncbi:MAG: rhomboid family intramembrane serine protease [Deltaproteobacteria bacterium]|nr:rhomboid family intramembrane serine protease [Deltaproteobacteria bacterium]